MAAKLVECASCGVVVDVTEAAVDTDVTEAGEDTDQREETLVDEAPELIRFYCADCWAEGAGR